MMLDGSSRSTSLVLKTSLALNFVYKSFKIKKSSLVAMITDK